MILIFVSACGESKNQSSTRNLQGLTCDAAKSQLETFMSQNQSCTNDSDCKTEYGGCIVLVFNQSTNHSELNRLKDLYDNACTGQGLCGIPPGTPKCVNSTCVSWP